MVSSGIDVPVLEVLTCNLSTVSSQTRMGGEMELAAELTRSSRTMVTASAVSAAAIHGAVVGAMRVLWQTAR